MNQLYWGTVQFSRLLSKDLSFKQELELLFLYFSSKEHSNDKLKVLWVFDGVIRLITIVKCSMWLMVRARIFFKTSKTELLERDILLSCTFVWWSILIAFFDLYLIHSLNEFWSTIDPFQFQFCMIYFGFISVPISIKLWSSFDLIVFHLWSSFVPFQITFEDLPISRPFEINSNFSKTSK